MHFQTQSAFTELVQQNAKPYSLYFLNWWLLKYDDLYKSLVKKHSLLCEKCIELQKQNLPYDCLSNPEYCAKNSTTSNFITLFVDIETITNIQRIETFCVKALIELQNINPKEWIIKHFDFWQEQVFIFCVEYLDNTDKAIKVVYFKTDNETLYSITVDRNNFENIEKFSDICEDLFYHKKLYPTKLKEITDEFEKL